MTGLLAYWFEQHEHGGFAVERAALGSCDLSILHVTGEWQWLVSTIPKTGDKSGKNRAGTVFCRFV
jgi:hypothetical protein